MSERKIMVYLHKPIVYADHKYDAWVRDTYKYLKDKGENPEEWEIYSFAAFDLQLEKGDITPETPVHFFTKNITNHD